MARCIIEQKPLYMNLWHDRAALIEEILQNLTEEGQREERIHWLETGLGIPEEMRQASEGKWTELAADGTIQGYLDRWQQELERLLAE